MKRRRWRQPEFFHIYRGSHACGARAAGNHLTRHHPWLHRERESMCVDCLTVCMFSYVTVCWSNFKFPILLRALKACSGWIHGPLSQLAANSRLSAFAKRLHKVFSSQRRTVLCLCLFPAGVILRKSIIAVCFSVVKISWSDTSDSRRYSLDQWPHPVTLLRHAGLWKRVCIVPVITTCPSFVFSFSFYLYFFWTDTLNLPLFKCLSGCFLYLITLTFGGNKIKFALRCFYLNILIWKTSHQLVFSNWFLPKT